MVTTWMENLAKKISNQTHTNIKKNYKVRPSAIKSVFMSRVLKHLIEHMVVEVLNQDVSGMEDVDAHNKIHEDFKELKVCIQLGVAEGVNSAILSFSGQNLDYYCSVEPFPAPINKELI